MIFYYMTKNILNQVRTKKSKVVVAMSGGVDSSVAAALLKKQGYEVIGVFMRFWRERQTENSWQRIGFLPSLLKKEKEEEYRNTCCSEGAEQAARAVATKLKIPFYVLRLEKEFKKAVVDYFLAEEKRGLTPNPCVVCNKKIKFGLMFKKALDIGADFLATGHYVRLKKESLKRQATGINKKQSANGQYFFKLFMAKDKEKDQSYFLYTLKQEQLSRLLFPLGDYSKEEVYQMAKKWRLPYRRHESFDLCFVANDRQSFIKRYLKLRPGKILDFKSQFNFVRASSLAKTTANQTFFKTKDKKNELGNHQGLALYTIGQRKNLPLQQGPWWVVKKDEKKNILYVSNDEKVLYSSELVAGKVSWLAGAPPRFPASSLIDGGQAELSPKILAKIRYKSEAAEATIRQKPNSHKLIVKFKNPQRAITAGQSVVFYAKTGELLGGGTIEK